MFVQGFSQVEPKYFALQEDGLRWLAWIHAQSDGARPVETYEKLFFRFGCGGDKIARRYYEFPMYCDYSERAARHFPGFSVSERMRFFEEIADARVQELDRGLQGEPGLVVHVSCTGYVSPSAVQKLVARKGWSSSILHAYHMGCYAAFPAIRHSADHVRASGGRADIYHTELCTLHLNPGEHLPEQLVVQSLFADGHIGYSVSRKLDAGAGLEILAVREELIPDSLQAMSWRTSEAGFQMTLAREVPDLIQARIRGFLDRLCAQAGVDRDEVGAAAYAIHPGGPRILDLVSDVLHLEPSQVQFSRAVLLERGNMSSATLPHVWMKMLGSELAAGRLVVSFAFGPGLTVFGSVMRVARS